MRKILHIGLTEFLGAIRSKAFIAGALAVPILSGGSILIMQFAGKQKDTTDKRFAVVDQSGGDLFDALERASEKRGAAVPRFIPEQATPGVDGGKQRLLALSDRVRAGDLFAFAVVEKGVIEGEIATGVRYYSATPTYTDLPRWIEYRLNEEITRIRFDRAGLDRDRVEELIAQPPFRKMELLEIGGDGDIEGGAEEETIRHFAVPLIVMMLLFIMVMTSAPVLLTTTLEEKSNKVSEFLVSAVSPFQLMMGKLLGALGTSLVLAALYLTAASAFAAHYGVLSMIPPSLYLWFLFFLMLSVMIYGSACVAIGSVCSEIRDAQGLMLPVTLMIVIPVLLWQPVIEAPSGSFARAATYFPPATPILLMLRHSLPPGLPWWELLLGTAVCVAFMVFSIWAAAKIFRIGILAQGQTPTFARLIRWVFSK